jgi:2-polyprenyl-3-methyl-5-hydroxy-6-metoxy-1,4-benzoquinol methylase
MTPVDRVLQRWRIGKAAKYIAPGARVLDIGSSDGVLFQRLGARLASGLGVDPTLSEDHDLGRIQFKAGYFPAAIPAGSEPFDVITLLAVLEHFPEAAYASLGADCARWLKPGGRLIITVPSPLVDHILAVLKSLRLIDGMSLEEHHGYDIRRTPAVFAPHFRLIRHQRFQLGLNHLFVFTKVES